MEISPLQWLSSYCCLFWGSYKTHKYSWWGKCCVLRLKQVVHKTSTVLWRVKLHEPIFCTQVDVKLWSMMLFVQYVSVSMCKQWYSPCTYKCLGIWWLWTSERWRRIFW